MITGLLPHKTVYSVDQYKIGFNEIRGMDRFMCESLSWFEYDNISLYQR